MPLNDWLLQELTLEAAATRTHLDRVPIEKAGFQPNEKSMTLGWLATFLAIMPTWGSFTLTRDSFDVAPPGSPPPQRTIAQSREQLLTMFDTNMADLRAALGRATDESLAQSWSLLAGGRTIFSQPRYLVLRTYFLNHMIHHRAQLGTYLRLVGVPVPAVYNASADEQGGIFMAAP
jgi:hypothetical protein